MARLKRSFGAIRRLPSKRYQASYVGPDGGGLAYYGATSRRRRHQA